MGESKLGRQHTEVLQAAVIWGSKRVFSGYGIWPEIYRARFEKTQIYWRDTGFNYSWEGGMGFAKILHGMWYWERKRHSGNSGMAEVRDA